MSYKKINQETASHRKSYVLSVLALTAVLCLALGACGGDSAGEPEETDAEVVASDASQPVVTDASTVTSDASEPAPGCGDGVKAGDEECDDHNNDSGG